MRRLAGKAIWKTGSKLCEFRLPIWFIRHVAANMIDFGFAVAGRDP